MKRSTIGVLVSIVTALPLAAQTPSACRPLQLAIEDSEKEMSSQVVAGLIDDSAPRATMRAGRVNNELGLIAVNLMLMEQLHCPPRKEPITTNAFVSRALECYQEMQKSVQDSPKCNRETWKRRGAEGSDAKPSQ